MAFHPADYGPILSPLLDPERLPELGPGRPDPRIQGLLDAVTPDGAFAHANLVDREMARACLAGLWLHHDHLDRSHAVSQTIHSATGSYWHGVMHRREGDYPNAKYWFRRTGEHPVFPDLARSAGRMTAGGGADTERLSSGERWDPYAFVDLCRDCVSGRSGSEALCRRVQRLEWELLFDFCYRRAAGIGITS
ncbi:MAG: hypothetical protein OXT71_11900 [Acidobacteriota bacterium]|nr:hypothetical protein [Acidobacteriota bacterium]